MLLDQFSTAVSAAPLHALDDVARTLWRAHGAGALSDAEAEEIAQSIEARRKAARTAQDARQRLRVSGPIQPRPRRSVDALERRRRLAASAPLPPRLAASFTTGELACLRIIGDEIRDRGGVCCLPLIVIARRAGVCRSTARNAVRAAERIGLLVKTERRRRGQRSETNVLRVISQEWRVWMKRGPKQPRSMGEGANFSARKIQAFNQPSLRTFKRPACGSRKEEFEKGRVGKQPTMHVASV